MAKQKFTHFVPRDKPKKRRGDSHENLKQAQKITKKIDTL